MNGKERKTKSYPFIVYDFGVVIRPEHVQRVRLEWNAYKNDSEWKSVEKWIRIPEIRVWKTLDRKKAMHARPRVIIYYTSIYTVAGAYKSRDDPR